MNKKRSKLISRIESLHVSSSFIKNAAVIESECLCLNLKSFNLATRNALADEMTEGSKFT